MGRQMLNKSSLLSIIYLVLLFPSISYSQNFGIVFGYSTSNAIIAGGHLIHDNFLYRFCVSFESSDAKGKEVSEKKPNYGQTIDGTGDYFTSYDLGLGYYITPQITIAGEISLCQREFFINYIDNRFTDGGYHMIDKSESLFGFGLNAGYIFSSKLGILIGYNTIRKLSLGMTFDF